MSIFGLNLHKKGISVHYRKSKPDHRDEHIRISPGTKFHLKETIFSFGPNLPSKGIFGSEKKEEMSPSIQHI